MKIAILAVTKTGAQLAYKIKYYLDDLEGYSTNLYFNSKLDEAMNLIDTDDESGYLRDVKFSTVSSFSRWMEENFQQFDAIICIMATGIVVRLIAPHIVHKSTDPAVVVLDEKGQFAISLISGHLGGANELAKVVVNGIGGQAVITTATDVQGKLAIDVIARNNNLYIEDAEKIKLINTLILKGQKVDIYSKTYLDIANTVVKNKEVKESLQEDNEVDIKHGFNEDINEINIFPLENLSIKQIKLISNEVEKVKRGLVVITNENIEKYNFLPPNTMIMRPRNIIIGLGCRRGVSVNIIEEAVIRGLNEAGLDKNSIINLASIDIKQDEIGLIELAKKWQVPIRFFSRDEIDEVIQSNKIENISVSEFVYEKIGVGGVCEPVIVLSNQDAKIVLPKTIWQGVTVAIGVVPSL